MPPTDRNAHATPSNGTGALPRTLRFELVGEDQRALLASHAIASALGVAFLLLIQFGPHPVIVPVLPPIVEVGDLNPVRRPTSISPTKNNGGTRVTTLPQRTLGASVTGAIGNAFSALGATAVGQP